MNPYLYIPGMRAGGNINPCRFVKPSTAADRTVLQAGAGEFAIGVSQEGTKGAPTVTSSTLAAEAGDPLLIYGPGSADVPIQVGSGGVTAGAMVASNASGQAVVGGTGDYALAVALETASEGEIAPFLLIAAHLLA